MLHNLISKLLAAPTCGCLLCASCSTGVTSSPGPHKGWLLVWTGTGGKQETRRGLSSAAAAGSPTSVIPGGPTFSVMAWPTKGGTTWSGCVFAYPQVRGSEWCCGLLLQQQHQMMLGQAVTERHCVGRRCGAWQHQHTACEGCLPKLGTACHVLQ